MERFSGVRVLVLGDLMLDHYIWGSAGRISPEAPVPVVRLRERSDRLGGAGNVARNVASMGGRAAIAAVVGGDAAGERLRRMLADHGVEEGGLVVDADRPTSVKTRVMAGHHQVARYDEESTHDLDGEARAGLLDWVLGRIAETDALIIADYGKGVICAEVLREAAAAALAAGKIVAVDPKESHFALYRGVTLMTPNQAEAEGATGQALTEDNIHEAGERLRRSLDMRALVITRGEKGMTVFEEGAPVLDIPAVTRQVYDVTGAGDTVVAALALALTAGAALPDAARLANAAAGVVVGELGTAAPSVERLRAALGEDG